MVEETGVPGENHRPAASLRQILSHNVVSSSPRLTGSRTHSVSGDYIGSYKFNYHTIGTTKRAAYAKYIKLHTRSEV